MSGVVKSVKKVFKKVGKAVKKVAKSKVFKAVAFAAAIYFGGAGLTSFFNGTGFWSGVSSAGTSLSAAGSSLMNSEFAAAGSHLSAGFSGTTVAAQQAALTQGTTGTLVSQSQGFNSVGGSQQLGGKVGIEAGLLNGSTLSSAGKVGGSSVGNVAPNALTSTAPSEAMSVGEGLMNSALISSGTQAVGGYMGAKAEEERIEDERRRRHDNIAGKRYGGNFSYDIQSAFTPQLPNTVDQLRGG